MRSWHCTVYKFAEMQTSYSYCNAPRVLHYSASLSYSCKHRLQLALQLYMYCSWYCGGTHLLYRLHDLNHRLYIPIIIYSSTRYCLFIYAILLEPFLIPPYIVLVHWHDKNVLHNMTSEDINKLSS